MANPKIWSGSAWVKNWRGLLKIWNGSAWVWAKPKIHDGTQWIDQDIPPPGSDSQTVTVGTTSDKYQTYYGFYAAYSMGSCNDGTSNLYSGAAINAITHSTLIGMYFEVSGNQPNSGWTKMTIDGVDYMRTSASYTYNGSVSSWTWAASNPFGGAGTTKVVTFS